MKNKKCFPSDCVMKGTLKLVKGIFSANIEIPVVVELNRNERSDLSQQFSF